MSKNTKIALIIAGVIAVGVTAYLIWGKRGDKSGNPEKDDKKVLFKRN